MNIKRTSRDQKIRECKVLTTSPTKDLSFKRTMLTRSPSFLVPLEIEPEYYSEDPMVKGKVTPQKSVSFAKNLTLDIPPVISNPRRSPRIQAIQSTQ